MKQFQSEFCLSLISILCLATFQNCSVSSNDGGALKLSSGAPPVVVTSTDDAEIVQFYVKSNGTVVVDSLDSMINGPLQNNGGDYYSKVIFQNTGTTSWTPSDYRVIVANSEKAWFVGGGLSFQCLDQENNDALATVNPGQICMAYNWTPNPASLHPTFAGIPAGTCVTKTIKFQMVNIRTSTLFGPTLSKDISICQN